MNKILITGAEGFVGYHTAKRMLEEGYTVHGLDNVNTYYEVELKKGRLAQLTCHSNFEFVELDLADRKGMSQVFESNAFDAVVHLAAQAGVRASLHQPHTYIDSNVSGFLNVLEGCRHADVNHLVFASSSSVYGKKYVHALLRT